jgi:hypothetical protein
MFTWSVIGGLLIAAGLLVVVGGVIGACRIAAANGDDEDA